VLLETSHRTMSDLTQILSNLQFEFPETSSFNPTFVHCYGRILLTECLFDPILLLLAS
jgi:hypothetical protein